MLRLIGKYNVAEWADDNFYLAQDEYGHYFYQMETYRANIWEPISDEYVTPHTWVCLEEYIPMAREGASYRAHTAIDKVCQKIRQMEERQNERKQAMSKLSSKGKGQEGGSPISDAGRENMVLPEMRAHGEPLIFQPTFPYEYNAN